ncbi:MAG TPA: co-chaperone GroES [Planctomycetes bacterium]|nr:co-chaperone GroES [Planctomycetota bacterium]
MFGDGRKLVVVGDRVLVAPTKGEEKTREGLILPASAVEKNEVQSGRVVEVGPGTPMTPPADIGDEPWKMADPPALKFLPLEANVGDQVLFLRKAAIEIEFAGETFLIVPHGAILVLARDEESDSDRATEFRENDFKV